MAEQPLAVIHIRLKALWNSKYLLPCSAGCLEQGGSVPNWGRCYWSNNNNLRDWDLASPSGSGSLEWCRVSSEGHLCYMG